MSDRQITRPRARLEGGDTIVIEIRVIAEVRQGAVFVAGRRITSAAAILDAPSLSDRERAELLAVMFARVKSDLDEVTSTAVLQDEVPRGLIERLRHRWWPARPAAKPHRKARRA